jgi:glucan biosynthesis protein C
LAPFSYDRKGAAVYVIDRLKRLGLPILFYAFILQPLLVYVLAINLYGFQGSVADFISKQGFGAFGVGPLWFVEELLIFSFVYVLWRRFTRSSNAPSTVVAHLSAPSNKAIALFALILGLVTFTFRLLFPVGWWLEPLHLQLAHLPQYIALFAVGIIAYRNNWLQALDDSQGRVWRWVVVALIPVFLVVGVAGGALDGDLTPFAGGLHWQALAMAVWEQFMCVAMIVTLLLAFRKRLDRQSGLARAMSDATYSTYVVHAPVIALLALSLSAIQLEGGVKFVLVAPAALSLAFAVGYLIKKLPVAENVL